MLLNVAHRYSASPIDTQRYPSLPNITQEYSTSPDFTTPEATVLGDVSL